MQVRHVISHKCVHTYTYALTLNRFSENFQNIVPFAGKQFFKKKKERNEREQNIFLGSMLVVIVVFFSRCLLTAAGKILLLRCEKTIEKQVKLTGLKIYIVHIIKSVG